MSRITSANSIEISESDEVDEGQMEQYWSRFETDAERDAEEKRIEGLRPVGYAVYAEILGPGLHDLVYEASQVEYIPYDDRALRGRLETEFARECRKEVKRVLLQHGFTESQIRKAFESAKVQLP